MRALSGTVVVGERKLSQATIGLVKAACHRADAACVTWPVKGSPPALEEGPGLLVAGLAAAEWQISREALDMMAAYPGLPLLLLPTDPLVRHTLSVQDGRVHLVSPPHGVPRIHARVRALLGDQRSGARRRTHDTVPMGFQSLGNRVGNHESERSRWWVGVAACAAKSAATPIPALPYVFELAASGLTTIVALAGLDAEEPLRLDNELIERVVRQLRAEEPDEDKEGALRELLPAAHGVIHLAPGASEWLLYWPMRGAPLAMLSPMRLPNVFHFDGQLAGASRLLRHRAASGDLVVGLSRPLMDAGGGDLLRSAAARASMQSGGSILLKALDEALRAGSEPATAVLAEAL